MAHKKAKDWYIALNHWVVGGFAIPLLAILIFTVAALPFVGIDANGNTIDPRMDLVMQALVAIVSVAATWFGAIASARYMRRKYIITNPMRIVNFATLDFIFIPLALGFVTGILDGVMGVPAEPIGIDVLMSLIQTIVGTTIFYFVSKKYLLS